MNKIFRDSDVSVMKHIESFDNRKDNPVGSSIIISCCETVITEEHVLEYIMESKERFDLVVNGKCELINNESEEYCIE